jgi:MBG domain (YGX type)/Secretion system C-terminal sorting domain
VKAANKTKKYGQQLPALTDTVWVDGVLLANTNPQLTLADLGLSSLTLTIPDIAINPGNVGTYGIGFSQTGPDNPALLEKYNYKFIPATLTIEKLPLTITAQDITVNYGDRLPDETFTYQFDVTNISNPSALLNTIKSTHQSQLAKDAQGHDVLGLVNGLGVVVDNGQASVIDNGQGTIIDNGQLSVIVGNDTLPVVNPQALTIVNNVVTDTSGYDLTNSDIQNLSFLATTQSLQNARQIANVSGTTTVVDITQESILNFNINAGQTFMLNSLTGVDPKGLIDVNSYTNGYGVVIDNGQGSVIDNGNGITIDNGYGVTIDNGFGVTIDNGLGIVIDNTTGDTIVVGISHNRTAVIVDVNEIGDGQSQLKSLNIITGLAAGNQFIIPGTFSNSNFDVTHIAGKVTINKRTITVKANDITRQYGDPNPPLTVTYSGFVPGENLQNSDVTGAPTLSTTVTQTTPAGTYPITVGKGTLASSNYTFSLVNGNGVFTITNNPCLIAHGPSTNFGSTSVAPTSLWLNLVTKVSGQLKANGDYLLFNAGTVTFNYVNSTPLVNNLPIPAGKIVADNTVSSPITSYNATTNLWTTKVPLGFTSTSDIFVTGAIINSSTGFVKLNGNTNSVVKGIFYSNKNFTDQWAYATAAYQPQFGYSAIAGPGQVVSINGTYRAGTPMPFVGKTSPQVHLVNGGSGGGGNNYTGSTNSYEKFTACVLAVSPAVNRVSGSVQEELQNTPPSAAEVQIIPNPASDYITLSFVPTATGNSEILVFAIDGRKVSETHNGICEAGIRYQKKIDVSKLITGVYLVQLRSADKMTIKKIIISR